MPISASLYNKTLDKLAEVEEKLKQYKVSIQELNATLGKQSQELERVYKEKGNYAADNFELRNRLQVAEKDLQRVALAYETVRSSVHLTSSQLNLDGINPTITSSITSLVKTNQTPETN